MTSIKDILSGKMSKKILLTKLIPIIIAVLFISIFLGNLFYPGIYDFRYLVISELGNKKENPIGYLFNAIGILIASILMIPMIGYYYRKLGKICKCTSFVGSIFFMVAIVGGVCLGTVDHFYHPIEKFHEILGILLLLGLWITMLIYSCPVLKDYKYKGGARQFNMKIYTVIQFLLWVPLVGIAASLLVPDLIGADWGWPSLEWNAKHALVILSFALWEWLTFVAITINFVLFGWLVPEEIIPFQRRDKKEKVKTTIQ